MLGPLNHEPALTEPSPAAGARSALLLLLGINMFNYVDRYVLAAVVPEIQKEFFRPDDPNAKALLGSLQTAFVVSYMVAAPLFGWLADRMSRWMLVGASVLVWSVATGASGLATAFGVLLITRLFVGVGEAGYGPAAPTLISDFYPISRRGAVLAWFYMAIPVGSALGYVIGGVIQQHFGWRTAFYAVVPPGLIMGVMSFFMKDPPRGQSDRAAGERGLSAVRTARLRDYLILLRTPSYILGCAGMTAMTFAIGGISFWIPDYLSQYRRVGSLAQVNSIFGVILVIGGLTATLLGGMAGDRLKKRIPGSYFIVSAGGMFLAAPMILLMLWLPFPYAWCAIFLAVFFLFFNTGPANTILANVTHPSMRATAFALNIFIIHALGDAAAPPILGKIAQRPKGGGSEKWDAAFIVVTVVSALAGALWLWGAKYLERDTALAPHRLNHQSQPVSAA
jgi:MFS family permease